jgi:hypothetical protein
MDLIGLLVVLIILSLIYWAVHKIAGAFGLPAPIVVIIDVVLVIVFVLYLLQVLGLWAGGPSLRLR